MATHPTLKFGLLFDPTGITSYEPAGAVLDHMGGYPAGHLVVEVPELSRGFGPHLLLGRAKPSVLFRSDLRPASCARLQSAPESPIDMTAVLVVSTHGTFTKQV